MVGFWGGPKFEANVCHLNPSATGPYDNLYEIQPICTFCHGVACEYFDVYRTQSCVVHVVGFWGGPKFEANVRCLNPSATGDHMSNELFYHPGAV